MINSQDLPKLLARTEKRLRYWRDTLTEKTLTANQLEEARELIQTYGLLISRASRTTQEADLKETLKRITVSERKLAAFFDFARLATNHRTATQLPRVVESVSGDGH